MKESSDISGIYEDWKDIPGYATVAVAIDMQVTRGANAFIYQALVKAGRVTEFNSPYSVFMSPKS
ncbi:MULTISPECIES: hypothetical protein [Moorena]|uniref:hypothetical protein n=1 Tax=Moorena TaxID=1155738 RepID=UPI00117CB65C|nr:MULTISPECIES: hypothetical protein [Moorena]NEP29754.1 hypothetical protein [Moorena sp. SIO3I6]